MRSSRRFRSLRDDRAGTAEQTLPEGLVDWTRDCLGDFLGIPVCRLTPTPERAADQRGGIGGGHSAIDAVAPDDQAALDIEQARGGLRVEQDFDAGGRRRASHLARIEAAGD